MDGSQATQAALLPSRATAPQPRRARSASPSAIKHRRRSDAEVAESVEAIAETFGQDTQAPSVCVADGWGLRVTVDGRHLVVADGMGPYRRERRYSRATHGLARVVVVGATGMVSLEALRWCAGAGVSLVVLDPADASVLATTGACAVDDGRLRRLQALAMGNEVGLAVARYLTRAKVSGQASVASGELDASDTARSIASVSEALDAAASLEELRQLEAVAANLYWHAWEAVQVAFVRRDDAKVPAHWRRFEGRRSAVNPGTPRSATDPVNAALNYAYRLVESEARLATLALGLDPGLGILHADMRNRDGFVLDLMEAARPIAERHVVRLLRSHTFRRRDFHEDARGVVRVLPPLTHRIAEAMPAFGQALGPVAEQVAAMLGEASPYDVSAPSVLTRSKHKAAARRRVVAERSDTEESARGRGPGIIGLGPRRKARQRPSLSGVAPLPLPVCRRCGASVPAEPDRDRARGNYCARCLAERRVEAGAAMQPASLERARTFAASTGTRPTHTPDATAKRQSANSSRRAEQAAWEEEHAGEHHDAERFAELVVPRLANVTLPAIAKATGMSTSAAAKVRAGRRVPHPRHWPVLAELAGIALPKPVAP
jgi:CRISPR-associated endonuclease Cas1